MEFTAQQIADLLNGQIEGNPAMVVKNLSKIEEGKPQTLSFLANPKYTEFIYSTDASVVIVDKDFIAEKPLKDGCTLIRVENAYESFAKVLDAYNQFRNNKVGIDDQAAISDSAKLGTDCYVGPFTFIGDQTVIGNNVKIEPNCYIGDNVTIGDNCTIHSGVRLHHDTVLGNGCIIHYNVVIGADGFGFAPNAANNYKKVAQIGNVIIESNVEIGANTCIDRATLGSTIIRKGVKLDNLIQVAHNVEIGENTVIAAQTGVAGSAKIDKNCMIGGQVGIVGHIKINEGVKIAAQSGIGNSIPAGEMVQGSPAFQIGDYKRSYVGFRKLPELMERIEQLEKELEAFKKPN